MHRWKTIVSPTLLVCLWFVVATSVVSASEIVGRWDLTIGTPPEARPSWLEIRLHESKYVARFVGPIGGVSEIGALRFDGSSINFQADNHKWTGILTGDTLSGTRISENGAQSQWIGHRFVPPVSLTGNWRIKVAGVTGNHPHALEITRHDKEITGTLREHNRTIPIAEASVNEGWFTFTVVAPTGKRTYCARVRGDMLEGLLMDNHVRHEFTAHRQREWAEPIELFNAKNLDGWKPLRDCGRVGWQVVDGVMTTPGGEGSCNLVTENVFMDFRLHVEFKIPQGGNSGIYLRGRYEIQVYDNNAPIPGTWFTPANTCGSLYNRIPPNVDAAKKHDEWQTFDIKLIGSYVTVVHNGEVIIDNEEVEGITGGAIDSNENGPGPIYLQGDHTRVYYRKVTLTPAK